MSLSHSSKCELNTIVLKVYKHICPLNYFDYKNDTKTWTVCHNKCQACNCNFTKKEEITNSSGFVQCLSSLNGTDENIKRRIQLFWEKIACLKFETEGTIFIFGQFSVCRPTPSHFEIIMQSLIDMERTYDTNKWRCNQW